jgi:hypothetical protein
MEIRSKDGVPWYEAPLPRRWHFCEPWSAGTDDDLGQVDRCACGGVRLDGRGPWLHRNSSR